MLNTVSGNEQNEEQTGSKDRNSGGGQTQRIRDIITCPAESVVVSQMSSRGDMGIGNGGEVEVEALRLRLGMTTRAARAARRLDRVDCEMRPRGMSHGSYRCASRGPRSVNPDLDPGSPPLPSSPSSPSSSGPHLRLRYAHHREFLPARYTAQPGEMGRLIAPALA
jgi:hypothetical protein